MFNSKHEKFKNNFRYQYDELRIMSDIPKKDDKKYLLCVSRKKREQNLCNECHENLPNTKTLKERTDYFRKNLRIHLKPTTIFTIRQPSKFMQSQNIIFYTHNKISVTYTRCLGRHCSKL